MTHNWGGAIALLLVILVISPFAYWAARRELKERERPHPSLGRDLELFDRYIHGKITREEMRRQLDET